MSDVYATFRVEAFEDAQRQNVSAWRNFDMGPIEYPTVPLHRLPSWLTLVFFGIATAIAWTCTSRAIYRIAIFESRYFLRRGVYLHEIPNMLELTRPSKSGLKWRFTLWKTTLFTVICIALYASTALTYRLAFSYRSKAFTYDLETIGKEQDLQGYLINTLPMLGCNFDPPNPSSLQSDLENAHATEHLQ